MDLLNYSLSEAGVHYSGIYGEREPALPESRLSVANKKKSLIFLTLIFF